MNRQQGFTLLEVLIALAILAISSVAVVSQTSNSLRQLHQLELKTTALWLADNEINRLRIAEEWPATGRQSQNIESMGSQWLITTQVSDTSDAWLRKLEVSVSLDDNEAALVSLNGYRGQY